MVPHEVASALRAHARAQRRLLCEDGPVHARGGLVLDTSEDGRVLAVTIAARLGLRALEPYLGRTFAKGHVRVREARLARDANGQSHASARLRHDLVGLAVLGHLRRDRFVAFTTGSLQVVQVELCHGGARPFDLTLLIDGRWVDGHHEALRHVVGLPRRNLRREGGLCAGAVHVVRDVPREGLAAPVRAQRQGVQHAKPVARDVEVIHEQARAFGRRQRRRLRRRRVRRRERRVVLCRGRLRRHRHAGRAHDGRLDKNRLRRRRGRAGHADRKGRPGAVTGRDWHH
mmetsp:Transcript_23158/g.60251  ORF Transcript_23158/g.60251 Transcript_23158/m.60251 type:complete len:287 (-) Transcript_23158:175-1035(-)